MRFSTAKSDSGSTPGGPRRPPLRDPAGQRRRRTEPPGSPAARSYLNGEATSDFTNLNANQSVNRTTADWKINFNAGVAYNDSAYELSDGEVFHSYRRGWNLNNLTVKSLGEHWSVAGKAGASRSSFNNQKQLATSYRFFLAVGFTYRFGSINNNVVNPRFGGGGGG